MPVAIGIVAVGILAIAIYYTSIANSTGNQIEADGSNVTSRLNLVAVTASHVNHEFIGKVEANQSFKVNEPVFIKTEFSNPNNSPNEHIIISEIKSINGTTDALAITQSDIAASGNTSMELYWQPEQTGDYSLIIFTMKPEELNEPMTAPLQIIPLQVVE